MLPMSAVILVIFAVILVIYKVVGSGDTSANRRHTPTDTPVAVETPTTSASPGNGVLLPSDPRARKDCLQGWLSFVDPEGAFSICFPSGWLLFVDAPHIGGFLGRTQSVGNLSDAGVLTVYSRGASYFAVNPDRCGGAPYADDWTDLEVADMSIGGTEVTACKAHYLAHFADAPPQQNVVEFAELPAHEPGRYIDVTLTVPENSAGKVASATWDEILATFRR